MPSGVDKTPPDITEYSRHVILRALKAFGIAHLKEIAFTSRYTDHHVQEVMERLIHEKRVVLIRVEGINKPVYTLPEYLKKKITIKEQLHILSPFDVVCVFRHRLRDFFDFDYSVECFVPEAKRKYGYFALPLLYGQKFIGRMDSKVDRTAAQLIIKGLYFDERTVPDEWLNELARSLFSFSEFNDCKSIRLEYCNRSSAATRLRKLLV